MFFSAYSPVFVLSEWKNKYKLLIKIGLSGVEEQGRYTLRCLCIQLNKESTIWYYANWFLGVTQQYCLFTFTVNVFIFFCKWSTTSLSSRPENRWMNTKYPSFFFNKSSDSGAMHCTYVVTWTLHRVWLIKHSKNMYSIKKGQTSSRRSRKHMCVVLFFYL